MENNKKVTDEVKRKKENKYLIGKFPFLLPRNRFTGKVIEDYDYYFTELDGMPTGWKDAFGLKMCQEIKEALGDKVDQYRITQIKEKYGGLRWYDAGAPTEVHEIISKYEELSKITCMLCGEPATKITLGWIAPLCDECAQGREAIPIDKKEE